MCNKLPRKPWNTSPAQKFPRLRRIHYPAVFISAIALAPQALADPIAPLPPAPASLLVGEMLRLDAKRALENERAKVAPPIRTIQATTSTAPYPAKVDPPAVTLLSIYGVGNQLYADMRIHGQAVTYAAGQAHPIRGHQQAHYRLHAIRLPCVQLQTRRIPLELCLSSKP